MYSPSLIVFYQLMNIAIVILNGFVVYVVNRKRLFAEIHSTTFRFIGQQSISDILFASAAIVQPLTCWDRMVNMETGTRPQRLLCELVLWSNFVGFHASPWFLSATALDRCLALYRPFRSPFPFKTVTVVIWAVVILADGLLMVNLSTITYFKVGQYFNGCFQAFPELVNNWFVQSLTNYRLSLILTHIVPLVSIGTLSMTIIVKLVRMQRMAVVQTEAQVALEERRKIQIIKMMLLIIFVYYTLTGMPIYYFLQSGFTQNRHVCQLDNVDKFEVPPFFIFMFTMARFGCISNPIILILFNKTFRSEFRRLVMRRSGQESNTVTDNDETPKTSERVAV